MSRGAHHVASPPGSDTHDTDTPLDTASSSETESQSYLPDFKRRRQQSPPSTVQQDTGVKLPSFQNTFHCDTLNDFLTPDLPAEIPADCDPMFYLPQADAPAMMMQAQCASTAGELSAQSTSAAGELSAHSVPVCTGDQGTSGCPGRQGKQEPQLQQPRQTNTPTLDVSVSLAGVAKHPVNMLQFNPNYDMPADAFCNQFSNKNMRALKQALRPVDFVKRLVVPQLMPCRAWQVGNCPVRAPFHDAVAGKLRIHHCCSACYRLTSIPMYHRATDCPFVAKPST